LTQIRDSVSYFKDGTIHHFRANNYLYCIESNIGDKIGGDEDEYNKIYQRNISERSDGILNNVGSLNSVSKNGLIIVNNILKYMMLI